ncbi:unnamed protein product, partial [Mesorhabditis belari]|uniref:Uncharacterized protein n=1 Tax=Mesorhabditis belari TaxID=2138241 RepID=A0AAF3J904_9BILA
MNPQPQGHEDLLRVNGPAADKTLQDGQPVYCIWVGNPVTVELVLDLSIRFLHIKIGMETSADGWFFSRCSHDPCCDSTCEGSVIIIPSIDEFVMEGNELKLIKVECSASVAAGQYHVVFSGNDQNGHSVEREVVFEVVLKPSRRATILLPSIPVEASPAGCPHPRIWTSHFTQILFDINNLPTFIINGAGFEVNFGEQR